MKMMIRYILYGVVALITYFADVLFPFLVPNVGNNKYNV